MKREMKRDMRERARELARGLEEALGAGLRSVVLHGSVARGEAVPEVSDINLIALVDEVDPTLLRRLAPRARDWRDSDRTIPLLLEWREWRAAADSFAIETADMLDHREILHGDDPLAGISVDAADLRVQAERELRSKLILFREEALLAADRPADLGRLLLSAMPSVAAYFRAVLRLNGERPPEGTPAVLEKGAARVGVDAAPLLDLWEKRGRRELPEPEVEDAPVAAVHDALERTAGYVDRWKEKDET